MGNSSLNKGADGRYAKQAKQNRKMEKKKLDQLVLNPHTPAELRGYIESRYQVKELEKSDDRYKRAYMNIKAQMVFTYAPELITTPAAQEPSHPPRSDSDPDYVNYNETEQARWKEAVMLSPDRFTFHLHVYNIPIFSNEIPVAWVEVYVESEHNYLSFNTIHLEYEEHYLIDRTIADIVNYFSATEEDKKERNERYQQLCSVQ